MIKSSPSSAPPPWNPTGFSKIRLSLSVSSTKLSFVILLNVDIVTVCSKLTSVPDSCKKYPDSSAPAKPNDAGPVAVINKRPGRDEDAPSSVKRKPPLVELVVVVARNTKPLEVSCVLCAGRLTRTTTLDRRKTSEVISTVVLPTNLFALSSSSKLSTVLGLSFARTKTPAQILLSSSILSPASDSLLSV